MNIEITILTSVLAVCISLYTAFSKSQRDARQENKEDAGQIGMILEKLANISLGIADLKTDLATLSSSQNELRERIARLETANAVLEAAIKRTNTRIDELLKG